ncbi:group 1 truncated hemoglobin [Pseudomonas sp. PDM14]|uniref:group I truncated hemoglobin n=1 Tax=Pseudomonas sp. PDM14 TaxID=2769288 RepID=UPI001786EA10|nr:group 1 truncated hemoglobin [Pseudomonas sp. PDM14]MBD9484474.1 group 1 truncated hemoglobin [Pseudomonas sp. PDM14]
MRGLLIALCLVLTACATPSATDDSLYRSLGEQPGITRIVEGMLLNVARDERIVAHFQRVDIDLLRDRLVEKFCVIAGGPCVYKGETMEEGHKGLNLTRSDFNALVENLIDSMDAQGIPVPTQNRLIARLAPMRGQVIER